MANDDNKQGPIFVTSYNQQGGITAGQVNFGPPRRDVSKASQPEIDGILQTMEPHREKNVSITVSAQDSETQNFANQLREFLADSGFKVGPGIGFGIFSGPVPPLSLDTRQDGKVTLIVGPNDPNFPG